MVKGSGGLSGDWNWFWVPIFPGRRLCNAAQRVKIVLPSLRRRVGVSVQLRSWLDAAIAKLGATHPAYAEFSEIKRQYSSLNSLDASREQVATFYKHWIDVIANAPKSGRSMALFQDLSAAYALGKSLPDLPDEGTARVPKRWLSRSCSIAFDPAPPELFHTIQLNRLVPPVLKSSWARP